LQDGRDPAVNIAHRLAWRNVWRNPRRTGLSVAATVFAVVLVMLSVAMAAGVHEKMIEDAVRLSSGHVAISGAGYREALTLEEFAPWDDEIAAAVDHIEGLRGAAPRITSFGLASFGDASRGVMVMGVDPEREPSVTTLDERIVLGTFVPRNTRGRRPIVLGQRLAEHLGVGLGDEVLLYGVAYTLETAYELFEVVGVVDLPDARLERSLALVHIDDARDFYVYGDRVSEIALLADEADDAPALRDAAFAAVAPLAKERGIEIEVLDYRQLMPELVQLILIDDAGMYILLVILIVVVGFGILNTILMAILERSHELGVILALGLRPWSLFRMVYLESMLLAAVGLVIGLAIAIPALWWLDGRIFLLGGDIAKATESFGMEPTLVFKLKPLNPIGSAITVFAVASIAALYPAWKASASEPVEAIRAV
jgi:ABC-type lipoprotein release transport system permease subunit